MCQTPLRFVESRQRTPYVQSKISNTAVDPFMSFGCEITRHGAEPGVTGDATIIHLSSPHVEDISLSDHAQRGDVGARFDCTV